MAIHKIFSKRNIAIPDVFVYDSIPMPLRKQIVQIIRDGVGHYLHRTGDSMVDYRNSLINDEVIARYESVKEILCREYGVDELNDEDISIDEMEEFIETAEVDQMLDAVELFFVQINIMFRIESYRQKFGVALKVEPDQAIEELNHRFRQHGVGYQFQSNKIMRIDSTLIHQQVTLPVLKLLQSATFSGANEEYLKAHEHFRHQRYKECINECYKAFESALKIICTQRNWAYSPKDSASNLIDTCFNNGLFSSWTGAQKNALKTAVTNGITPLRNNFTGHGQGNVTIVVSEELASYALNLTASNILLVVEASKIK